MSAEDIGYRKYVGELREVCRAHLCAAGWLLFASATLVHVAETRYADDDAMLARLGEIVPADDDQPTVEAESDREFLLDRAASHRRKAEAMSENAVKLFAVLTELLQSHVSEEAELGCAEEVTERLKPYVLAIERASAEFATLTAALDAALGNAPEWQDSLLEFRGAQLFLSEESALFSDLVDGGPSA